MLGIRKSTYKGSVATAMMVMASVFLFTGCEEKSSDAVVDKFEYIGFMDNDEEAGVAERPADDEVALAVEGQFSKYRAIIRDGKPYLDIDAVKGYIDDRFFYDKEEKAVLFTNAAETIISPAESKNETAGGKTEELDYVTSYMSDKHCYLSMEYVSKYADFDYWFHKGAEDDPSILTIEYSSKEYNKAVAKEDNEMRTDANLMNAIITTVKKDEFVNIIEETDEWYRVQAQTGYIGYVQKDSYDKPKKEKVERSNDNDTYQANTISDTVRLVWQQGGDYSMIEDLHAKTGKINVVSPTWLSVSDTKGNITNDANPAYVEYAHSIGMQVWVLADDFQKDDEGMSLAGAAMEKMSSRKNLIDKLVGAVEACGADGLNIDFELVKEQTSAGYREFLRELSLVCRSKNIILSADNYVPNDWNYYYGLDMQALVCDYVVLMTYDEFTAGSEEPGPGASVSFVEKGIKDALETVGDSERLIAGIPFYTRVWKITPEEYAPEDAKIIEDADFGSHAIDSEAVKMETAKESYTAMGAEPMWNEKTGNNYVSYDYNNTTYMMWIEDADSIRIKLQKFKELEVGGFACWKLGQETEDVWKVLEEY